MAKKKPKKTNLPLKWGVAAGIVMGVLMFLTHILNLLTGYGTKFLEILASVYPGYTVGASTGMCFLLAIYAFIDAGLLVFLTVWVAQKLKI